MAELSRPPTTSPHPLTLSEAQAVVHRFMAVRDRYHGRELAPRTALADPFDVVRTSLRLLLSEARNGRPGALGIPAVELEGAAVDLESFIAPDDVAFMEGLPLRPNWRVVHILTPSTPPEYPRGGHLDYPDGWAQDPRFQRWGAINIAVRVARRAAIKEMIGRRPWGVRIDTGTFPIGWGKAAAAYVRRKNSAAGWLSTIWSSIPLRLQVALPIVATALLLVIGGHGPLRVGVAAIVAWPLTLATMFLLWLLGMSFSYQDSGYAQLTEGERARGPSVLFGLVGMLFVAWPLLAGPLITVILVLSPIAR